MENEKVELAMEVKELHIVINTLKDEKRETETQNRAINEAKQQI